MMRKCLQEAAAAGAAVHRRNCVADGSLISRRYQAIKSLPLAATVGIGAALAGIAPANADLMINPNGNEQDRINDAGGTTGTGVPTSQPANGNGLPTTGVAGSLVPAGLTGYNSQQTPGAGVIGPSLIAVAAGNYLFTYMGKGNAGSHNTFTFDGHIFDNISNTPGDTFTVFLPAMTEIDFTYTNVTASQSVTGGGLTSQNISYFVGLDASSLCTDLTDPNVTACTSGDALASGSFADAYIGLADLPWTKVVGAGDHDFQDLGVRVDELSSPVPEPTSAALLATALLGLLGFQYKRRQG